MMLLLTLLLYASLALGLVMPAPLVPLDSIPSVGAE